MVNRIVNIIFSDTQHETPEERRSSDVDLSELRACDFKKSEGALRCVDPMSPRLWMFKGIDNQDAYNSSLITEELLYNLDYECFEDE